MRIVSRVPLPKSYRFVVLGRTALFRSKEDAITGEDVARAFGYVLQRESLGLRWFLLRYLLERILYSRGVAPLDIQAEVYGKWKRTAFAEMLAAGKLETPLSAES